MRLTRSLLFWTSAGLMLLAFQYMIFAKERILTSGNTLFLELAPVDPRSLMQGDYMQLNYALNSELRPLLVDESAGFLVVRPDAKLIGQPVRAHDNTPLTDGEYLLRVSVVSRRRLAIKPDSFFFQEGHATYYERAKYGVFQCENRGPCLLTGLADADMTLIVPGKASE